MSQQPAAAPHTGAFFGTALLFLAITGVWNLVNMRRPAATRSATGTDPVEQCRGSSVRLGTLLL
jgi:predicted small integral membrane protein